MSNNDDILIEDIISEVVPMDENDEIVSSEEKHTFYENGEQTVNDLEINGVKEKSVTDTDVLETITALISEVQNNATVQDNEDNFQKQIMDAKNSNETAIFDKPNTILEPKKGQDLNKSTQLLKTDVKRKVVDGVAETVETLTTTLGGLNPLSKEASLVQKGAKKKNVSANTQRLKTLLPKDKNSTNSLHQPFLKKKLKSRGLSKTKTATNLFEENPSTKTTTIIHMKCDKCGLAGQFEDRINEFGCPQCDGIMKPLSRDELNNEELAKEIKVSHQEVVDYQEKVKLATAVVDNIFSNTSQRLSQLETASKILKRRVSDGLNNDNRVTVKLSEPSKASRVLKNKAKSKNPKNLESHSITKLIPPKNLSDLNVEETVPEDEADQAMAAVRTDSNHRFDTLVSKRNDKKPLKEHVKEDFFSSDSRKISKYATKKTTTLFEKNKIKSLSLDDEARKRLLSPINFQYETKDNRSFYLKLMVILLLLLLLLLLYYFLNKYF